MSQETNVQTIPSIFIYRLSSISYLSSNRTPPFTSNTFAKDLSGLHQLSSLETWLYVLYLGLCPWWGWREAPFLFLPPTQLSHLKKISAHKLETSEKCGLSTILQRNILINQRVHATKICTGCVCLNLGSRQA